MNQFKKVAIIGVGFMGGSLALRLKQVYPDIEIFGYARSSQSFHKLKNLNIVDKVSRDIKEVVSQADIVILAGPIYVIIKTFKDIAGFLKPKAVVFDLGSSKQLIETAAKKSLPKDVYFVGAHPLCGSESKGAQFSQPDIYKGATCIITTNPLKPATKFVSQIWEKLGCKLVFMKASKHDQLLSKLSHLPHILAFALSYQAGNAAKLLSLPSFNDLTRISSSPAQVWSEIILSNKVNILQDIRAYIKVLEKIFKIIKKNDPDQLVALIEKVNKIKAFTQGPTSKHSS